MPQMTIEFDGLLRLLGHHLYSDKRVFIREMIQNAHDSIVRRQLELTPDFLGRIDIQTVPHERRVTFRDNGLGMNRDDIVNYLSKVAASATRETRNIHD